MNTFYDNVSLNNNCCRNNCNNRNNKNDCCQAKDLDCFTSDQISCILEACCLQAAEIKRPRYNNKLNGDFDGGVF